MDKSAKKLAGLALGSFCLALVWTTQGFDKPKPVIPTKAPAKKKSAPLLTPPPAMKSEKQLAAFAEEYLKFSPELYRVVMGSENRRKLLETTAL
jgi:hypothetical protein